MAVEISAAKPAELARVIENFYQMWLDMGFDKQSIVPDWREQSEEFIADAVRHREGRALVARQGDRVVGSAICQLFAGLYPSIVRRELRKSGYIWGVYVDRVARRQGIATALTQSAIDYLRAIHCTRVLLHASPDGQPVYHDIGFRATNERALELTPAPGSNPADSSVS